LTNVVNADLRLNRALSVTDGDDDDVRIQKSAASRRRFSDTHTLLDAEIQNLLHNAEENLGYRLERLPLSTLSSSQRNSCAVDGRLLNLNLIEESKMGIV
jgi:hypothetical protein